jgi:hypothetical protein
MSKFFKKIRIVRYFFEKNLLKNPYNLKYWLKYLYFELRNGFLIKAQELLNRFICIPRIKIKKIFEIVFFSKILDLKIFLNKFSKVFSEKIGRIYFFFSLMKYNLWQGNLNEAKLIYKMKNFPISKDFKWINLINLESKHGDIENSISLFENFFFIKEIDFPNKISSKTKYLFIYLNEKKRISFFLKYVSFKKIKSKKKCFFSNEIIIFWWHFFFKFLINKYYFFGKKLNFSLNYFFLSINKFLFKKPENIKILKILAIKIAFLNKVVINFFLKLYVGKKSLINLFNFFFLTYFFSTNFFIYLNFFKVFEKFNGIEQMKIFILHKKFYFYLNFSSLDNLNFEKFSNLKKKYFAFFLECKLVFRIKKKAKKFIFEIFKSKIIFSISFNFAKFLNKRYCSNFQSIKFFKKKVKKI